MIKLNVWLTMGQGLDLHAGELVVTDPEVQGRLLGQFRYLYYCIIASVDALIFTGSLQPCFRKRNRADLFACEKFMTTHVCN